MTNVRENWQVVGLLVCFGACGPAKVEPDAGPTQMVMDAGVDAGLDDAGLAQDAGIDAGVPTGWSRGVGVPGPQGLGLWGSVLAYDERDKRFILHGGNRAPRGSVQNATWSFSLATQRWTELTTTGDTTPGRYCHCTTYLPQQHQVLVTGGRAESFPVESAYTLDLATLAWTEVSGTVPTAGIGCNAHWLPSINKAVVFGGDGSGGTNDRTWAYDPVARSFSELMPATRAGPRRDAMSFVDPSSGRMVVFGGSVRIMQSYLNDVVTFDGTTWTAQLPSATRPSPRRYSATGFDAAKSKWILFGGTNDADDSNDLWTMDPATFQFTQLTLSGAPSERAFTASGIDPVTKTLYVFGGLQGQTFTALSDGYTFRLP